MDTSAFEASLRNDGYTTVAHIERAPDYALGEHAHAFDAFAFITQGEITLTVDGTAQTYRAGDTFRLAAGTLHLESAGLAGVQYVSGRREVLP